MLRNLQDHRRHTLPQHNQVRAETSWCRQSSVDSSRLSAEDTNMPPGLSPEPWIQATSQNQQFFQRFLCTLIPKLHFWRTFQPCICILIGDWDADFHQPSGAQSSCCDDKNWGDALPCVLESAAWCVSSWGDAQVMAKSPCKKKNANANQSITTNLFQTNPRNFKI